MAIRAPDVERVDFSAAYDGSGVAGLLGSYHHWAAKNEASGAFHEYDRLLDWMFDGDTAIGPVDALVRFLGRGSSSSPNIPGHVMAWAVQQGLVVEESKHGEVLWRRMFHTVAFVPRGQKSLDVRNGGFRAGPISTSGLVGREAKHRIREQRLVRTVALAGVHADFAVINGSTVLPAALRANDLPPVETFEELRFNFDGFEHALSPWRIVEVWWHVRQVRVAEAEARWLDDLHDLRL
jgi:hypothetical protein